MKYLILFLLIVVAISGTAEAQNIENKDSVMISVFLRHQQDKNLDSLRKIQEHNKFLEKFPPKTARVISWYVMMGIGQVVTVKIPAAELRTLNLSIEQGAWGAFTTDFYPTYDYMPIWREAINKNKKP